MNRNWIQYRKSSGLGASLVHTYGTCRKWVWQQELMPRGIPVSSTPMRWESSLIYHWQGFDHCLQVRCPCAMPVPHTCEVPREHCPFRLPKFTQPHKGPSRFIAHAVTELRLDYGAFSGFIHHTASTAIFSEIQQSPCKVLKRNHVWSLQAAFLNCFIWFMHSSGAPIWDAQCNFRQYV